MRVHPVIVHAPVAPINTQHAASSTASADQMVDPMESAKLSNPRLNPRAEPSVPSDTHSGQTLKIKELRASNLEKKSPTATEQPRRRDSLKHREAILRGKEGSRQRRRWENGKLQLMAANDAEDRLISVLKTVFSTTRGRKLPFQSTGKSIRPIQDVPCLITLLHFGMQRLSREA